MSNFEEKYRTTHKRISLVKSGIRIAACLLLSVFGMPAISYFAIAMLSAEILGVVEEMI